MLQRVKSLGYACILFILSSENGEKKLLLQHKDDGHPNPEIRNKWTFFGGSIEAGETTYEALIREIGEELGLKVKEDHDNINNFKLFKQIKVDKEGAKVPLQLYTADFKSKESDIVLGEGQDFKFFRPEEILNLDLLDHERVLLEKFFAELK